MNRLAFASGAGVYFTGDHHFGHANVIGYSHRPFQSVEGMDAEMVRRWNAVVQPTDTVFHLGDFAFKRRKGETEALLAALHGTKHLIVGNHDHTDTRKAKGWASVEWYQELSVGDQPLVLCHYAFQVWNASHYGTWHLHGHSHGSLPRDMTKRRLDVGVDCWNYTPASFADLEREMAKVTFVPVDHHKERADG